MMGKNVAWRPLPGSQSLALSCPCDEILMHGTRGPGKTTTQIAYFMGRCGMGYGKYWRGIIFDRGYKNLGDIIEKAQAMIPPVFPKAKFKTSNSDLSWHFPDGETLLFRHMKRAQDYRDYHGHEYPFIGWNELTSYPTSELYDLMMSCNRSSFVPRLHSPGLTDADKAVLADCDILGEPYPKEIRGRMLPELPLVKFSTTNPHGPGHSWVKKRFIDCSPPGVPVRETRNVFDPRIGEKRDVTKTRVALFGSYKENRFLSANYVAELDAITDPAKRAAWLQGDWSVTSGGALDDLWNPAKHVRKRFKVPKHWKVTRSFDWGSTHPFSVGWWAKANGEEVDTPQGKWCPPRGSLVRIAEIYGVEVIKDASGLWVPNYGSNAGLRLSAREVARQINEREAELLEDGWIAEKPSPGPADGQIFNVNEAESDSIAQLMQSEGVTWRAADKSRGTRKNGLELMRAALEGGAQGTTPGLFVMDNCRAFLNTVPSLPRDEDDPDDVDTNAEDHVYDEARYMILDDAPTFTASMAGVRFAK